VWPRRYTLVCRRVARKRRLRSPLRRSFFAVAAANPAPVAGAIIARRSGMDIVVTFPGGKRADAHAGPFTIATDQSVEDGGQGSAPSPFTLFLSSLATCAGLYVLAFCATRAIATDGIRLVQRTENDARGKLVKVTLEVHVPADFPADYRDGVARAASACKVKKLLASPPRVDVLTVAEEPAKLSA
jgi:ribosomal protein S12 methylthiotransferase accessory factor